MLSRIRIAVGLILLFTLATAIPVLAGGWAVITLDELPAGVVAGEPVTIGFTVLQHGRTPMDDLQPTITARLLREMQFVVQAEPDGKPGHYVATLTFPKEGDWNWSIQAFSMDQLMPAMSVAAPAAGATNQSVIKTAPPAEAVWPWTAMAVLALGIGFAGLMAAYRRRNRVALTLGILGLLVLIGSLIRVAAVTDVEARSRSFAKVSGDSSSPTAELGRQLFVAKGCITCHVNSRAARESEYWTIETGAPNLSAYSASPESLRLRLKDPASIKSDAKMPNLGLSDAEIEALIAFINSK